jgi:dissimilatory sulfite reductase (desulfoviridin) alpha/beta subunit
MNAAEVVDGVLSIDENICNNCGRCIGKCHFDAIEEGKQGYKITIGGRWGKKVNKGLAINKIFKDEEEVMSAVEKMILIYREQGNTGERLADTIERIGFENIEAQLLSDEILERKQEILDAKLHLTGGATC